MRAFAGEAAARVGERLLVDGSRGRTESKEDGSLVTAADRWADETLREAVRARFPDHGALTEEGSTSLPPNDWCWVIDPIDGTTNFARGLPIWGISLGLLYRGEPVFGHVRFPAVGQSFDGIQTGGGGPDGAWLNGRPIRALPREPSENRLFNVCARSVYLLRRPFPCKLRMLGSATYNLLLVAAGASLGGVERTPKIWDIAAAWPILHAAGAVWIPLDGLPPFPARRGDDYAGRSYPTLVAAGPELGRLFHDRLRVGPDDPPL
ncbi:MAG: inositol monophosphatase family protein [Candidatus Eisenbacteria bacterium]|nr:inositol monophosphatase family protein [Candidatus Eisenbacteria bacterium]